MKRSWAACYDNRPFDPEVLYGADGPELPLSRRRARFYRCRPPREASSRGDRSKVYWINTYSHPAAASQNGYLLDRFLSLVNYAIKPRHIVCEIYAPGVTLAASWLERLAISVWVEGENPIHACSVNVVVQNEDHHLIRANSLPECWADTLESFRLVFVTPCGRHAVQAAITRWSA